MEKVLIVVLENADKEAEAIRQVLEGLDCFVGMLLVGRPNHFLNVIEGKLPFEADTIILCGHGDKGEFTMCELAETVYAVDEPHGAISPSMIRSHLGLRNKVVLSTCCTTGYENTLKAFQGNTYIAPGDYVESAAALIFVINFMYALKKNKSDIGAAFHKVQSIYDETKCFRLSENSEGFEDQQDNGE